jgi:hypothetical protein
MNYKNNINSLINNYNNNNNNNNKILSKTPQHCCRYTMLNEKVIENTKIRNIMMSIEVKLIISIIL